ncbi:MAG: hypothetical protein E7391_04805 [Ruminococcaceae bacterium]|nr:hypothetical protein [Oscillospiraceae bacterium]
MNKDIDRLKEDIIDYYGTAISSDLFPALVEIVNVDKMTGEELLSLAQELGFNIDNYRKYEF